jgi:GTP-binding protein LepA
VVATCRRRSGDPDGPAAALLVDSLVRSLPRRDLLIRIVDGTLRKREQGSGMSAAAVRGPTEVGVFTPKKTARQLGGGEVGF